MALFAPKRFGSTFPTTGYTSSGRKTAGIGHDLSRFRFLRIASARSIPRPVAALREMPTPLSSTTPGHRTRKLPDLPSGLENCRHERNGLAATQKHSALGEGNEGDAVPSALSGGIHSELADSQREDVQSEKFDETSLAADEEAASFLEHRLLPVVIPSVPLKATHRAEREVAFGDFDVGTDTTFKDEAGVRRNHQSRENERSGSTPEVLKHRPEESAAEPAGPQEAPRIQGVPLSRGAKKVNAESDGNKSEEEGALGFQKGESSDTAAAEAAAEEQMGGHSALRLSIPAAEDRETDTGYLGSSAERLKEDSGRLSDRKERKPGASRPRKSGSGEKGRVDLVNNSSESPVVEPEAGSGTKFSSKKKTPTDVQSWIDTDLEFRPDRATPLSDLTQFYQTFCEKLGIAPRGGKKPVKLVSKAVLTASPDVSKSWVVGPRAGYRGVRIRDRPNSEPLKGESLRDELETWARACLEVRPGDVTPLSGKGSLLQSYERFYGGRSGKQLLQSNVSSALEEILTSLEPSVVEKTRIPGHVLLEGVGLKRNGTLQMETARAFPLTRAEHTEKMDRSEEAESRGGDLERNGFGSSEPDPGLAEKGRESGGRPTERPKAKAVNVTSNETPTKQNLGSESLEKVKPDAEMNGQTSIDGRAHRSRGAESTSAEANGKGTGDVNKTEKRGVSGAVSLEDLVGKMKSVGLSATSLAVEAYSDAARQADAAAAALRAATATFAAAVSDALANVRDLEAKKRELDADQKAYAESVRLLLKTRDMLGEMERAGEEVIEEGGESDWGEDRERSGEGKAFEKEHKLFEDRNGKPMSEGTMEASGKGEEGKVSGEEDATWRLLTGATEKAADTEEEAMAEAMRVAAEAPFVVRAASIALAAADVDGVDFRQKVLAGIPEAETEARGPFEGGRNMLWRAVEMAREDSEEGLEDFGAAIRRTDRKGSNADGLFDFIRKIQSFLEALFAEDTDQGKE